MGEHWADKITDPDELRQLVKEYEEAIENTVKITSGLCDEMVGGPTGLPPESSLIDLFHRAMRMREVLDSAHNQLRKILLEAEKLSGLDENEHVPRMVSTLLIMNMSNGLVDDIGNTAVEGYYD